MIIDELVMAQNGNQTAADNIIKHYNYFIYYLMREYNIDNKMDCYDYVTERMLKAICRFDIKKTQ